MPTARSTPAMSNHPLRWRMARIGMGVLVAAGLASCSDGAAPDAVATSNSPDSTSAERLRGTKGATPSAASKGRMLMGDG